MIEPASGPDDRINLTDSDAKLLPGKKGGYHPAYNTQIAVLADPAAQIHQVEKTTASSFTARLRKRNARPSQKRGKPRPGGAPRNSVKA